MDGAIHLDEAEGTMWHQKHHQAEKDCTRADVWRASSRAIAFGSRAIAAAPEEVAVANGSPAPAPAVLQNKPTPTCKPTASAPMPATKQTVVLARNATALKPAAAVLASTDAMPAAAAAANAQQLPADVAKQPAPPITHQRLDSEAKERPERAGKRGREAEEAKLKQSQDKRRKRVAHAFALPAGSGGKRDLAANKHDSYLTIPPLLPGVGLDCFEFVRHAEKYITSDMSAEYNNVVERTAMLTPTERAALVSSRAHMLQEDQAKILCLLQHSVIVAQHLMHLNK